MTKVSIVIPVYNVETYLRECLESAVNQTLYDIEIICVNDGSTDGSLEILKEYEEKYDNLKVINQKNKGLGGARNTGINNASGEYIYFLDSDDYINIDMIERCYTVSKSNDLDIAILDCRVFYEDNEFKVDYIDTYGCLGRKIYNGIDLFNNIKKYNGNYWWSVSTQFYKKEFLHKIGLIFDENVFFEDIYYGTSAILKAYKIKHVGGILYNYRRRLDSITTKIPEKKHIDGYVYAVKKLINMNYEMEKKIDSESNRNIKEHIKYFIYLAINECNKQLNYNELNKFKRYLIENSSYIDIEISIYMDSPMLILN